jgi:hAT family C-terminal dimerisation region
MNDECLKATLLHPLFKNYPMLSSTLKERLVSELKDELQEAMDSDKPINQDPESSQTTLPCDIENLKSFQKLFGYDTTKGFSGAKSQSTVRAEVLIHNYLSSETTLIESLQSFPDVGKLFVKYNTILCSSAASERLFSLAKHVLEADRCQLTDENFENQLLLKANLAYKK